jgi:hypothetical protein
VFSFYISEVFLLGKKSISPSHLWGVDYITPNLWNGLYHPFNFPKPVKLALKVVLKNHSKSLKNCKMENQTVLDLEWVDVHTEHVIWYDLVHFFTATNKSIDLKLQQKI